MTQPPFSHIPIPANRSDLVGELQLRDLLAAAYAANAELGEVEKHLIERLARIESKRDTTARPQRRLVRGDRVVYRVRGFAVSTVAVGFLPPGGASHTMSGGR